MITDLLTSSTAVSASLTLTAVGGFFVAWLAYRGYRRNNAPMMRSLAIGIGLLTTGVVITTTVVDQTGGGDGAVLLARGLLTVAGLSAILHALLSE